MEQQYKVEKYNALYISTHISAESFFNLRPFVTLLSLLFFK